MFNLSELLDGPFEGSGFSYVDEYNDDISDSEDESVIEDE